MKNRLMSTLKKAVDDSGLPFFRDPLLGIAGVNDLYIRSLRKVVNPGHMLPEDLLPGARSVVAYFLPFNKHIVDENRGGRNASRLWAEVYIKTNRLLAIIAREIAGVLAGEGFKCAWEKPTHNFDTELLVSYWSHKHVAFACGLGLFGKNHLLVTGSGCAGRIGSLVTNWDPGDLPDNEERSPFYRCPDKCVYCFKSCPTGALGKSGLDKPACYGMLLENDRLYPDLELCDVCGKCSTGPCAVLEGRN